MSILKEISVTQSDCKLKDFSAQFADMISDGSWAIRTDALKTLAKKPPKFILEQLIKPTTNPQTFESIAMLGGDGQWKDMKAIESQNCLVLGKNKFSSALCIPFYEVDGDLVIYANARLVKMLSEMFPTSDWFSPGPNKPIYLVHQPSNHAVAILMPFQIDLRTELRQPTEPDKTRSTVA